MNSYKNVRFFCHHSPRRGLQNTRHRFESHDIHVTHTSGSGGLLRPFLLVNILPSIHSIELSLCSQNYTNTHSATMSDDAYDASLDLLRRLNPRHISKNLNTLCQVAPSLAEDLLSSVDQPLGVKTCAATKKKYLTCDYNRDGDSYRSPWSNAYDPALADGTEPSAELRELELGFNDAFDIYRDLYYEGGISSSYLWDQDGGFAGVALFKKTADKKPAAASADSGVWDSIHVFEVEKVSRKSANYKLTSTVILDIRGKSKGLGSLDLGGNLTRQTEQTLPVADESSHIANIGSLIEDMESKLRNILNEVYFGKTRDIIGDLRSEYFFSFLVMSFHSNFFFSHCDCFRDILRKEPSKPSCQGPRRLDIEHRSL